MRPSMALANPAWAAKCSWAMLTAMVQAVPPFPIARFSVDQYHRMIASGAFDEHDQVELIEGWVVQKMAKGPGHEYTTGELEELLRALLPPGWHIRNQGPITLRRSEPEPDMAIVRGARSSYRAAHPRASDVAVVVEVSDTILATDRHKARTYAAEGVPECWIVNLAERSVEVHRDPGPGDAGYRDQANVAASGELSVVVDGQLCGRLAVARFLP